MTDTSMDTSYQMSRQKIIFTGDPAVGKTSIINTIMGQKFTSEYEPSIGVDFFSKTIRYKSKLVKLQIWDSAGQEKFKSLIPNYIRGSSLVFLVYDVSKRDTFEHLSEWIGFINNIENSNIVIVGNKIDLKESREVSKEDGENFCKENNYEFFEVSAKEDTNLDNMLFSSVAGLPFFQTLNSEGENREKIFGDLLQENLDSFRLKNNKNYGGDGVGGHSLNVAMGSEEVHNNESVGGNELQGTKGRNNDTGLINQERKKRKSMCC